MQAQLLQNGLGVAHQSFVFLVTLVGMRELEQLYFLELVLAQDAARIFSRGTGFGAETRGPGGDPNG